TTSSLLPPVTTEPLPTVIPSDTPPLKQYTMRTRIAQSLVLPPVADEPASPFGDDSQEMASKINAQELEISQLKGRVKLLEDRERGGIAQFGDDTPIKRRSLDEGEEAPVEKSTERGSDDTKKMVTVLTSLDT
nr:hypothetical protein [Tanacetum cinerariifolium]